MPDPLARLDEIAEDTNRMYGAEWSHLPDGVTEISAVYIATFSPELVKRLLAVVGIANEHRGYCGAIDRLETAIADLIRYLEAEKP